MVKNENREKQQKKMIIILSIFLFVATVYLIGLIRFSSVFLPHSVIDGIDVSGMDISKSNEALADLRPTLTVIQRSSDGQTDIEQELDLRTFSADLSYDASALLKAQDVSLWFLDLGKEKTYCHNKISAPLDSGRISELLNDLYCTKQENIVRPEDAHLDIIDGQISLIKENDGSYIDEDIAKQLTTKALQDYSESLENGTVDLRPYYEKATITADDPSFEEKKKELEDVIDKNITIDISDSVSESISKDELCRLLKVEGSEASVDTDELNTYINDLAAQYDVSSRYIDKANLKSILNEDLLETTDASISVNWIDKVEKKIEVKISEQKLYYYENGELMLESPVVTGNGDITDATPTGDFAVRKKANDSTLLGAGYVEHVDYWIGFDESGRVYGFHDASWRNEFGGDIYLYDPSRGCVNMPTDKVAQLFEMADIGTAVHIRE